MLTLSLLWAKEWGNHIKSGHLLVDGQQGKAGQKLRNNQRVVYLRPDSLEPSVDADYEVLYEDEWLIGLNKSDLQPASGRYFKNTLMHLVVSALNSRNSIRFTV